MSRRNHSHEKSSASGPGTQDVQQQISNTTSDLARLRALFAKEQARYTQVQTDRAEGERHLLSLRGQLNRTQTELEAVQRELDGAVEDSQFLRPESMERDASGRTARRLWLANERVRELEERLGEVESSRAREEVEAQEEVASLREKLARAERALREKEDSIAEASSQRRSSLEHDVAVLQAEAAKLKNENQDLRDAARAEGKHRRAAEARVEELTGKLQSAQEEVRGLKDCLDVKGMKGMKDQLDKEVKRTKAALEKVEKVKAQLAEMTAERERANGSPRALQSMSPNLPSAPRTPTKAAPASGDANIPKAPNASLAKSYEYLQRKHRELKTQFDSMRSKYAQDIQHWKEYRAIQMARQELRQKRRDEKKAESMGEAGSVCVPSSDPASLAASEEAQVPPSLPPTPAQRPRTPLSRTTASAPAPPSPHAGPSKAYTPTRAASTTFIKETPQREYATPTADRTITRQPSRVTPWLGQSARKVNDKSEPSRRRRDSFSDDDDPPIKTASGVRTPLVRDRTGETSLRRAALTRTVTHTHDDSLAGRPEAGPSTPDSERKRKLDHEALSPAERAAARKRLALLSTTERREVYAAYKGKGRYIAPEDVQRTVADEYEIDPARNGGVAHAFHSVERNREERRKMHGGDCECCRDYYEAIGPLPRFNHAPKWNDDEEEAEADYNSELVDHQNRISRHREVWRKPPTPPDYWKIGFPSTQDVAHINEEADEMAKRRDSEMRMAAAHRDSKWRKKQ